MAPVLPPGGGEPGPGERLKNQPRLTEVVLAHRDSSVREIFVTALEAEGIRVYTTDRGEEVIRLAREEEPDLILLALDLANVDGWQVAEVLAGSRGGAALVIALTADAREGTRRRALEAGFHKYISLPIAPWDLLDRLNEEVRSRQARGRAGAHGPE